MVGKGWHWAETWEVQSDAEWAPFSFLFHLFSIDLIGVWQVFGRYLRVAVPTRVAALTKP